MEKQLCLEQLNTPIKSCAFTGHRVLDENFSIKDLEKAVEYAVSLGVENFYCGMAMGFDLFAGETVLKAKKTSPNIRLIACIPFYQQDKYFSVQDKKRYEDILKKADETVFVSEFYFKGCMQKRDRYMADRADMLITYCKKNTGGTAYTVEYFQKKYQGKEIVFL